MATDLGRRIERARKLLGLTQAQVAARVGKSERAVGSWERGEKIPQNLYLLEQALAPYFTVDGGLPQPPTDPKERELWELLIAEDLTPAEAWEVINRRRERRRAG